MSFRPLTYKKVYINSKYRTSDSAISADFSIELRETFEIPDGTIMQIHEIAIPNTWYAINSNNNSLYFGHQVLPPEIPSGVSYRRLEIAHRNYTAPELATAIQSVLNTTFDGFGRTNTYTVSYNAITNKIRFASNYTEIIFIVLPDSDLTSLAGSFLNTIDPSNPKSIKEALGHFTSPADFSTSAAPWDSGFVNLLYHQDIVISCPQLSNNNFHSPSSFTNAIVKKVPVNVSFAGVVYDAYGVGDYDFVNVSKRSIRQLTFRITDGSGNLIDFNGINISFSLLFHNTEMR